MAEFDSFAAHYDEALSAGLSSTGENKQFFAEGRVAHLRASLKQLGLRPNTVMDFGCGPGTTTGMLRERLDAERAIGVDVSSGLLDVARRTHHDGAVSFFSPDDWATPASIDVVYCNGVLHHIPPASRPMCLQYIRRVLRPGGIFALWENNPWNPGTRLVMSRIPFDRAAETLSCLEAVRLLRDEGFNPLRTDHAFFFPRPLKLLRPLEAALRRVPLGGQYQVLASR